MTETELLTLIWRYERLLGQPMSNEFELVVIKLSAEIYKSGPILRHDSVITAHYNHETQSSEITVWRKWRVL
jgi:hypothetical protein